MEPYNRINYKFSLFIILLLVSCKSLHEDSVFDRVISYYEASGDTMKVLAVKYLQKNAIYHYGVSRRLPESLNTASLIYSSDSVSRHFFDSCGYAIKNGKQIWDIGTITEDYIIENIDMAFDSWAKPWAQSLSFDDFCKYILPYRNGDEELSNWRKYFKEKYEQSIMDSVPNTSSVEDVAQYIIRCLRREIEYGPLTGSICQELMRPEDIERLHWVGCLNAAHYTVLAMRSCGIPCTHIDIHWRFTEVTHSSVLFPKVGNNTRAFRLTIGDTLMYMGAPKDTMAAYRVWAKSFEPNPSLVQLLGESQNEGSEYALDDFAIPVTREDVTNLFCKTYDFSLPVPDSLKNKGHLFLCRFYQWKWLPIREGGIIDDSVYFYNATIRQLYRLGYFADNRICAIGTPFTLSGNSGIINNNDRIRPYNLTGDTVLFKRVYACSPIEKNKERIITTYYWNNTNHWTQYTGRAQLWGLNRDTGEYRCFEESLRKEFTPVFYLLQIRLPCWTIFTDDETPRPLGFIAKDSVSNEGYFMEF